MTIFDYSVVDIQFVHWLKRKREMLRDTKGEAAPKWLDAELDRLRPLRNQECSIFILDGPYGLW